MEEVQSRLARHLPEEEGSVAEGGGPPPVFCFQTALQMMLWSWIAYTYTWVPHF